jgi:hypothetical protein
MLSVFMLIVVVLNVVAPIANIHTSSKPLVDLMDQLILHTSNYCL